MAAAAITFLYRRLAGRYPLVFVAVALQSALFIVAGTLALFSFYYDGALGDYLIVLALALALTEAGSRLARAMGRRWWAVVPTHVHYFTRGA